MSEALSCVVGDAAAWLGICVFAAQLFDGYRAYAAVLSRYTVAIIAAGKIDNPRRRQ